MYYSIVLHVCESVSKREIVKEVRLLCEKQDESGVLLADWN